MTRKLYSNPNESGQYYIKYATQFSRGNKIEIPMRLVVIEYETAVHRGKFAVRWQDKKGNTSGGYSYDTEREAHNAFLRRYLDHNDSYKEGNPSHLPGMNNRV